MRTNVLRHLLVLAALAPGALGAQATQPPAVPLSQRIEITLEHDSEGERATRDQLRRVLDGYDVGRWMWTDRILIDQTQIPHSHPILTLHTRALGNEADQLSTLVHEQFHWWAVERDDQANAAIAEFAALFPNPPVGGSAGARDTESTWLHLLVCDLELQAMEILIGPEQARELLDGSGHYTWIYDTILNDPRIREVVLRNGFDVSRVDAGGAGGY